MICVSIGRTRHKMMILEHRHLAEQGAELVELRLDWLSRQPDLGRLLNDRPTPIIVTCRRTKDRGRWRGNEDQRLALLRAAIVAGVEYVDLEEDIAARIPRYGKTKRIVSHHDFDETPADLEAIHARLAKLDPDIVKIVTMANSPADCVRMMRLVSAAKVPTAGFCMGELGQPSRILCGKFGAPFTYATFSRDREMAPGQLAFEEMQRIYRYDSINAATRVFGVLGDPIAHSLSPLIHNAAYQALGMNAVYVPLRVLRGTLPETLKTLEFLEFQGYSVTIPHKEAALEYATACDPAAKEIGAANTLSRDANGGWKATNSDYDAALDSLRPALVTESEPAGRIRGKKVLMLGAGGVARAIGLGIVREGGLLTISNRTSDRARTLADELGCQSIQWENRGTVFSDVLINCTAVGMHPSIDETPFAANWLREGMVVFDTIYNPENTLLLKQARERDCRTVSGVEMFVRQAAVQFERFTGQPAPLEAMRSAMREGISPVKVRR